MKRFAMLCMAAALALAGCKKKKGQGKPSEPPTPTATASPSPTAAPLPELPAARALPAWPTYLKQPPENAENPTTPEKVTLGFMLFFDKRLAPDDSMACEGCHHIPNGYSSGAALDAKVGGGMNKRNAPSMLNLGYHTAFYWDGRKPTLEATSAAAWAGQLGAKDKEADIASKLNAIPVYRAHFQRAFKADASKDNIAQALGSFLRVNVTHDAPWDANEAGNKESVLDDARKGFEIFRTAGCAACHVPPLYSDSMFHHTGVGWDKPEAERDQGRKDATKDEADSGKFKTPSLRNVDSTAPYFHDGSAKTLEEAVDYMLTGGGDRKKNPLLDEKLKPVKLKPEERTQLLAFLRSLTGIPDFAEAPTLP